jgi:hypothetical protein
MFLAYEADLSSEIPLGQMKKALLPHIYPKPGKVPGLFHCMRRRRCDAPDAFRAQNRASWLIQKLPEGILT